MERVASAEDRHGSGVGREEHGRLPGRVARADYMHVQPVGVGGLATRCAIRDALPGKSVKALYRQLPPSHAAGKNDRAPPDDVPAVQVHVTGCRIDARHRPGHENFGAKPPPLLQRAPRQLISRDAGWETEVVLDS